MLSAYNDAGDFYFDVCCRGHITSEIAPESLEGRICAGAVVNTDRHRAYPKVMRELSVAVHNAFPAEEHEGLTGLDQIHGDIRTFLAPFKGVSTRWLQMYLGWYKWLRCFSHGIKAAASQIAGGDYVHRWRSIRRMGSPFRDAQMRPVKR